MKTRLLIILFAGLIVSGIPGTVFGPPYFSDQARYDSVDVIVTGEIISFSKPSPPPNIDSSPDTVYDVKISQYVKNNLGEETLQLIARGGPQMPQDPMGGSVNFKTGDSVYLYLYYDKTDTLRINTLFSHVIEQQCEPVPKNLEHLTGEPSSWEHRILDSTGKERNGFAKNEKIRIQKDIVNTSPYTVKYQIAFSIHAGPNDDDKTVFGPKTLEVTLPACIGHTIVEQEYTVKDVGDYLVLISADGSRTGFHFSVTEDGWHPSGYGDEPTGDPILKQHKEGTPDEELRCFDEKKTLAFKINGAPACLTPKTLYKLLERGWVAPKQYESLPDMENLNGLHHSEIAFFGAEKFLQSSPTFAFDGEPGGMSNKGFIQTDSFLYLLEGDFTSKHSGYGNREGQELPEQETRHFMALVIRDGIVENATMDNRWDMMNQKIFHEFSEDYKYFELRYGKYQDGYNAESLHIESHPGILRVERPLFDEHYLLDPNDAENIWNTIQQNNFFDMKNNISCTDECSYYSLSVKSGGTYNEITWSENNILSEDLQEIHQEILQLISEQKNGFGQYEN